jgi:hypothetical protein
MLRSPARRASWIAAVPTEEAPPQMRMPFFLFFEFSPWDDWDEGLPLAVTPGRDKPSTSTIAIAAVPTAVGSVAPCTKSTPSGSLVAAATDTMV